MILFKLQLILLTFLFYQQNIEAKPDVSQRIINGYPAVPKQFPYQVYLNSLENYEWSTLCGGAIISKRIILTAAHCISDSTLQIIFGAVDKSNIRETGQQRLIVKRKNIIVHHEYISDVNTLNDIALIRLPVDLQFDDYIQAAKLPESDQLYENEEGVVSGWGRTSVTDNNIEHHLMYYNVSILPNDDCSLICKKNSIGTFFSSSYICLKPSGSTPCNGDSGGPLAIRNEDGSSTLLGLTSFGIVNCPLNSPAIYTRVSSFLQWIKENEFLAQHENLST